MGWRRRVARRFEVLFRKRRAEDELDSEIRFHLEMEIREHIKSGLTPAEARRRARVEFGGVERFKEEVRDVRGARLLDDLIQDLKVSWRSLAKQPAFTLGALITLGVGIGGNVAMFAVLDASMFAALPLPDAERLVTGRSTFNDGAMLGPMLSGFDFFDYRDQATTLSAVGAIAPFPSRSTVSAAGDVERADVVTVSTGFFGALGVEPVAGRSFVREEGESGGSAVAILAHGYWVNRFGSDPGVVGTTLAVNGTLRTIVGVMPPEGRFLLDADLWIPAQRGQGMAGSRAAHNFLMVARLAPGTSLSGAQGELDGISSRLEEAYPDSNDGKGIVLTPMREMMLEQYRSTLALLVGAVSLLLVVACANVAGLLLARGQARVGEMAVRSVMGAGRGRLVRQLLAESTILALGAGVLGLFLAAWGQRVLLAFVSLDRLGAVAAGLSLTSSAYALGLSLVTVLLFGALPAFRVAKADASSVLRGASRVAGSVASARLRGALVVAQVALTAVLLSVSGLLGRSLSELTSADLGFQGEALLTGELDLPASEYGPEERIAFFEELHLRLSGLPGVTDVGLVSQLPLRDPGNNWGIGLPGELARPGGLSFLAHQRVAFPGYFDAMGIRLVAGRDVEPSDRGTTPAAIVLSRSTAEQLFGQESALGRLVDVQSGREDGDTPHQVVGVVSDVVMDGTAFGAPPAMYYAFHDRASTRMRLALRHQGNVALVASGLREVVRAMDSDIPLDGVETMASVMARGAADQRALAVLVAMFAAIALLLAGVGLYGVLAYQVSQRLREIGIRIALGASVVTVSASVVRGGLILVGAGLLVGVPASLFAGRLVQGFLFGVGSADPLTYVGVALFLGVVASGACLLPARRAARVNPVEAFRAE